MRWMRVEDRLRSDGKRVEMEQGESDFVCTVASRLVVLLSVARGGVSRTEVCLRIECILRVIW